MKTAGIITEYNPLHYGHLHLLQAVRQRFGEDTAVICAMSGDFVQRGDFALLRRYARAEAAVESGADLVLELPLPWAVSSAEGFARGGVETLTAHRAIGRAGLRQRMRGQRRAAAVRSRAGAPGANAAFKGGAYPGRQLCRRAAASRFRAVISRRCRAAVPAQQYAWH